MRDRLDMDDSTNRRRKDDINIQVVIERITGLHDDVTELKESMRDSMKEIASALNKLVIIETKQAGTNEAFDKVLHQIDVMQERLNALEREEPIKQMVQNWVTAGVWAAACASVAFVAKHVGLF
jgi:mevalonate kinase